VKLSCDFEVLMVALFWRNHLYKELSSLLSKHSDLVREMAFRDVSDRYSGQVLGVLWAIGHPLFMMALYVFVFAFVFKTKVGGTVQMPLDYTVYIMSGLIPWMAFQDAMNRSCVVITSNASLVKQVVFPLEVLPVKTVLSALLPQFVSLIFLLVYVLFKNGSLFSLYILLPSILAAQIIAMLGVSYFLSALGVYFRDIKDFIQLFGMAGMYMMPIFYLPDMVPSIFKPILYLNPFSYMVWCYQDVIYFGQIVHQQAWFIYFGMSFLIFIFGYRFFRKLKAGFGNIL
jgi:lipopolysaccharide transport system permease protein